MHFFDFLQLNETEQVELLWYNGIQIGRRKEEEFLILLYQVEGFYVEVFYHTKERVIQKYVSFECDERLDPYLDKIDISGVYRHLKKPRKQEYDFVSHVLGMAFEPVKGPKTKDAAEKRRRSQIRFWDMFLQLIRKSDKLK